MSTKEKYPSIFWPQMEAIVFIILQIVFTARAVLKIGKYINNSLHLARKYAGILVRGHYRFEKRTVFRKRSSRKTTPLCNRPGGIFIATGFSEKPSLSWQISHCVGLFLAEYFNRFIRLKNGQLSKIRGFLLFFPYPVPRKWLLYNSFIAYSHGG